MNLKAVIIDAEESVREMIEQHSLMYYPNMKIVAKEGSVAEGIEAIKKNKPHFIFLDIHLSDGSGFDLLKHFPLPSFKIIFITALENYAMKALKLNAIDYLLKPIEPDELYIAIEKAQKSWEQYNFQLKLQTLLSNLHSPKIEPRKLILKTVDSIYVVSSEDIVRCEAVNNYTQFFLMDGKKLLVSTTLKEYEDILSELGFFRSHQSHLVNLNYLERYDKSEGGFVVMKDKSTIPVALRKKEDLIQILKDLR